MAAGKVLAGQRNMPKISGAVPPYRLHKVVGIQQSIARQRAKKCGRQHGNGNEMHSRTHRMDKCMW